jgi:hypothetical protein
MALLASSVPLSLTIDLGLPRVAIRRSSSRATLRPRERDVGDGRQAFPRAVIEHGKDPEAPTADELIGDKIQRPAVVRS